MQYLNLLFFKKNPAYQIIKNYVIINGISTFLYSEVVLMSKVNLLIVDDELNVLHSLKRTLIDEDFEIILSTSGPEGLKELEKNENIALILSDMRMPGMTGVEFLEKAKDISPDTLRIILTGYADIEAAIEAINRAGLYRYITKPWKDEELLQTVKEAVSKYKLITENKRLAEMVKKQKDALKQWNTRLNKIVQDKTTELIKKNEILNKNYESSIFVLTEVIELRNTSLKRHCNSVTEIAVNIAKKLNLKPEEIENIRVASLLHDIGKIGFSDSLIHKDPADMSPEEILEYRKHPLRGQITVDPVENLREAGILIRHHHERYDGTGFPDGLTGQEIPLGSRIISVADFVDKMTTRILEESAVKITLNYVLERVNKQFDPKLYEFLENPLKELHRKKLNIRTEKKICIEELNPGMIIAKDIVTGSGITFLPKGTKLNEKHIESINRYEKIDPSPKDIFILEEKSND